MRQLTISREEWPIAGSFTISRGSKTVAEVIVVAIRDTTNGNAMGHGECVPYARYGETPDSVTAQIESVRAAIEAGCDREEIERQMPPGAARNAVDCAMWDLTAKISHEPVHHLVCTTPPRPIETAMTISLGSPQDMADQTRIHANRALLKVKLGGEGDVDRIHAVAASAPHSRIILDANEAWTEANLHDNLMAAAERGIALIEQPLPVGQDDILAEIPHPVPICADESVHDSSDLEKLQRKYDAVNIKLDKTGGLTEALKMRDLAHAMGYSVMAGCMVGTSLAMAPAVLLAQNVEFVDLDGPLLLSRDRDNGLVYSSSTVSPPSSNLWG